tara:strand:+ start:16985 stop:18265 length:1281 start_codon:yes stop_codon:yes gene_type:complete
MSARNVYRQIRSAVGRSRSALRRAGSLAWGETEAPPVGCERFGLEERHVFFGYYDLSPVDRSNDRILALSAPLLNRSPSLSDVAEIGYFQRSKGGAFQKLAETTAWCWQQGCRLQWYPRAENGQNNLIIFNSADRDGFCSYVFDIANGRTLKRLPEPIYEVAPDGAFALTLDFVRLGLHRPGYGYAAAKNAIVDEAVPAGQFIKRIDLSTGKVTPLVALSDIARLDPDISMAGAVHYFNHLSIAPDGQRYIFYHFWHGSSGRRSRVFLAGIGSDFLTKLDLGTSVSHYAWIDAHRIIVFCRPPESPQGYWILDLATGSRERIDDTLMLEDGHPSILSGGGVLTDTYPDSAGRQKVVLHGRGGGGQVIGSFYNPMRFRGEVRCDLHPRISPDENYALVDSARDGARAIYMFPIEAKLEGEEYIRHVS